MPTLYGFMTSTSKNWGRRVFKSRKKTEIDVDVISSLRDVDDDAVVGVASVSRSDVFIVDIKSVAVILESTQRTG